MTNRYILFKRGNVYYSQDRDTGQQLSLRTRHKIEATSLIQAKNDAIRQPLMNLALARTYLSAHDQKMLTRTWDDVMTDFCNRGTEATRMRHRRVVRSKPMQLLRNKKLIETIADDFIEVIQLGGNSTNTFLQTLHNDALGMGWLPSPILPKRKWPKIEKRLRRAITVEEHKLLTASFESREWKNYLELLWLTGASQTDAAMLTNENLNWNDRVLSYHRAKLKGRGTPPATLSIGKSMEALLKTLPRTGPLFLHMRTLDDRSRSCLIWKRCKTLNLVGVSLHSYRYSWAERAKIAGIPQRWAQSALGHNSKAVHDAYARNAVVVCPALEN